MPDTNPNSIPDNGHDDWMYKKPDEPTSRPHFTRDNVNAVEAIFQRHTMYRPELRANAMYMQAEMYGTVPQPLRHELQEAGFTVAIINHYPNIVIIWRPVQANQANQAKAAPAKPVNFEPFSRSANGSLVYVDKGVVCIRIVSRTLHQATEQISLTADAYSAAHPLRFHTAVIYIDDDSNEIFAEVVLEPTLK